MKYGELSLAGMIVIVLIGMRYGPVASKQGSAPAFDKTPAARKQIATPPVWKALCKLRADFGVNPDLDKAAQTIPEGAKDPTCLADLPRDLVVSAIATVPDPVTTNLGLLTDRTIESIQTSAAEAGYIPYLEALPWPVETIALNDSETGSSDQSHSAEKLTLDKDADRQYPGVLIFRSNGPTKNLPSRPKYLAVFLVSETPTAGLAKEEAFAALRIIGSIPSRNSDPARKVLVAGPFFSGSVASLEQIAREIGDPKRWPARPSRSGAGVVRCLQAYSGTITHADANVGEGLDKGCGPLLTGRQTPDLEALTLFTSWATDRCRGLGYKPSQIAFLSEEGTKYGDIRGEATEKGRRPTYCSQESSNAAAGVQTKPLLLHFPRGIASLRNATDLGQGAAADAFANAGPKRLPLRWQDVEPMSGETPLYGGYQTSLSQETVLIGLAGTLKSQDIRLLGIMASDPWDVTFLIHWFTEASPNVRLFVRDADLLYLRTPDIGSVTGIITLNDQPLIAEQQFAPASNSIWMKLRSRPEADGYKRAGPLLLPSSSEEGQYKEFTQLLKDLKPPVAEVSYPEPLENDDWADPRRPFPTQHLWVAATGTQGFLPLGTLPSSDNWQGNSTHELNVGDPAFSSIILFFVIALPAALHALVVFMCDRRVTRSAAKVPEGGEPPADRQGFHWRKALPPMLKLPLDLDDGQDPITVVKMVCHAMALTTAALATIIAGGSFVFFWQSGVVFFALASLVVLVEVLLLSTAVRCFSSARRMWKNRPEGAESEFPGNTLTLKVPRFLRGGDDGGCFPSCRDRCLVLLHPEPGFHLRVHALSLSPFRQRNRACDSHFDFGGDFLFGDLGVSTETLLLGVWDDGDARAH